MSFAPSLVAFSSRVWPRVAQFANSPSLIALALLFDGASALLPAGFRTHKFSAFAPR